MKSIFKISIMSLMILFVFSCKQKEKAETSAAAEVKEAKGARYIVNAATSKVMWSGSKLAGTHSGTLNVTEGNIKVANGIITGGSFNIDMNTLTCTDLEGERKANLEGHLMSADFFDVAVHPNASFEITKVTALQNDPKGTHLIYGNLTLKETTKQVGFKSKISIGSNKVEVQAEEFNIDRTDWGLQYGSQKFSDVLKDKAINDMIGISINLSATAG